MQPGTPHFVVTVEDCLALGGHFYNKETFSSTVHSIVLEHYMGLALTNTDHPTVPLTLFKLLSEYKALMKPSQGPTLMEGSFQLYLPFKCASSSYVKSGLLPLATELATLVVLVDYINKLEPQSASPEDERCWQCTSCFALDHSHAVRVMKEMKELREGTDFEHQVMAQEERLLNLCRHCKNCTDV